MAAKPNEVRRSNFFISQSPSDDEEFPYWTPTDYLERKFARTNAQVWELVRSRQCVDTYTRNPALDRKLMEAVEMFGSEPENLQRTATKRSGDITVYSLLAQRCWRDVAKHIGTGVTPRQCEERYLQLIAASKRFDEQNIENGLVKVPLRAQQPYIEPTMPRNKARTTKSISDSNFDSINDLVQQDMHSSQRTYKGPNLHKRKRPYQGSTLSMPFDAYDMEIDDDHAREVTKLKKQYARLAQTQDVPTQSAPAKFTKQVTEVAKVKPARPVENVNIYKKHYIADALAHTLMSPKRTSAAIAKQSTTTVSSATTENAAPKRKYNVNKYKGKVFTRRKDAADSDFESYDSWKSDDLRTDDSAFDTSSSSDYYSSDDNAKPVSSVKSSNKNTSTEAAVDANTTVRDVLASIVSKIESAFSVTTTVSTGCISTPILAILPPAEPSVVDEGNDLSDDDLESAYSSSSSRAGDAYKYHNSNIMYNYEFFEEQSADTSDLDDIGSVESLCSVSSNSTTTDYTPFIDPAIFKYDDTDFYANETAMNTTLDNTMQNKKVGAVQQSLTEKSDNVADILAEIVDTIVARNRPSPIVTTMNTKLPTGVPKTVRRHSNVTTASLPTTHPKLFKNNHDTTPAAPIVTLPPLPPADETLLKSLLPTRRYRKKDINWKFLALLVGRKGSEIRAYAAQWRYEKRVELLNKLITLREHSTKKKSRRKVRTVRRPKKTENPKKFTPSNPSKPPVEKKNAVKAVSSTLTLPAALVNNSPSQTSSSVDNPTNSATLTLHEMPPPSLHPVFDHTLLRAFLNVPGATRSAVGTGGTAVDGDEVRAEFHTELVEHNSPQDNLKGSESREGSDIVGDGDRIDTTNSDVLSEAMYIDKSDNDNNPDASKSANIIPKEGSNTTVTFYTTTATANVNTDPRSRELISETLNISENEIEVAEILTQSRSSADLTDTDGSQLKLHNQNVLSLQEEEAPTVVVTPVTPVVPAVPISTIASTDSIQEKTSENGHIAPPDDATDLQLVKSMLLAITCNKSWTEVSKMTNLSEQTAAYCLERYQQIQQHYPQYIDSVAVKVYLNNKVKRDTTLVEAMQKQSELTEQEQQLLQAVYLCHTGQLPILHAYLTNPLFNQVGVLCGTLCNWQYDAISKYLRWGRAQCQSRYAKLLREYKQKYPNASVGATPAATPATADSLSSVPANVDFAKAASYLSTPSSHLFSGASNCATVALNAASTTVTPGGDTNNPAQRPPSPLPRLPVPQFTAEKESLLMDLITRASSKLTPFVFTHAHSIPQKDRVKYLLDWLGEETWDAIALYVGIARRNCIDKYYTLFQMRLRAEMDRKVSAQRTSLSAQAHSISSSNNSGTSTQLNTASSATSTTTTTHTSKPISNTKNPSSDKNIVKSVSTTPRADLLYCHERLYYNEYSYPWSGAHGVNARELLLVSNKAMRIDPWTAADARVCKAKALYAAVLGKMKRGASLDAEMKADLRTTLETHFSNAMPTSSFYFEGRNRSEDDWLVRLVWVQAASAAKNTAPPKPSITAITSNTAIHTDTVQSTTISSTAAAPATGTPSVPESTAAALSAPSIASPSIPFDPTNPISAVRRILPLSAWDTIALRLGRSAEWCQDRYFLLLQAKLSNSYPATASQKLIFEYPSLKIGAMHTDTVASVSTSVTKKPRLKAVLNTVLSESQSHTQPQASGQNTTSTTGTSNASASVPGSTILPSATVGVKRKKNSDATSTKTKIQKAVYPETSGPSGAHPMVTNTSQNSMSGVQSTSAYSGSVDPARDTMPSNHAFSSGFHHHTSAGSNSTQSNPMANNRTGVTMGIMASIPTMAEYEISSNNESNDG